MTFNKLISPDPVNVLIVYPPTTEGMEVLDYPEESCEGAPLVRIVSETDDRLLEVEVTDEDEDSLDDTESQDEEITVDVSS